MGIFQADLTIKTAIELGINDMRKNSWLIDDVLSDCLINPYLKDKYGQKQIDACKEWLLNNEVDIYMRHRDDKDRLPCITITLGNSQEKAQMKTMGDASTESVILLPNQIGKPIPYIVKPFAPISYDSTTGELTVDINTVDISGVTEGMILVDPDTGEGFLIQDSTADAIIIEPNIELNASTLAVVPQFAYYKARVEHSFFDETYNIGCHAHGDPQVLLWLHSIVIYSLLRYRESLLEAQGFSEIIINSTDMSEDPTYTGAGGEKAFVRYVTLNGQVENTWIKSPRRYIENAALKEKLADGYAGGIKILSNLDTDDLIDITEETWYTKKE